MSADLQDIYVNCKACGKALWKGNASGFCRKHIPPDRRAKMAEGIRRKIKHDPVYLEKLRSLARANSSKPGHIAKMVEASVKAETWRVGQAALTPESYAKAGRTFSARYMAWCPPELRDEYRRLTGSKKIPAKQARAMILEQHDKAMADFRRKLSA